MAKKWNLLVDVERCNNCRVCFIAVKDEHNGNDFPGYAAPQPPQGHKWLDIERKERGTYPLVDAHFVPTMCNHCDDAPCVSCCPTGASHVDPFGQIVMVTHDVCIGCKACVASCPYDARFVHPEGYVDKCTFCIHRVKEGKDPACVSVCPTHCMHFVDFDDPNSRVSRLLASRRNHPLKAEAGTRPRIYYLV